MPQTPRRRQENRIDKVWGTLEYSPEKWLRERHPDWSDEEVETTSALINKVKLTELYEDLTKLSQEIRQKHPEFFRKDAQL